MVRPRLHLIDGSGYVYRAFYAVRELSTTTGDATNAVHGFSQMLEKTLREEEPTHIAVVFDSGRASFRNQIFPEYKANRSAPPDELVEQVPKIHELVGCFRIRTFIPEEVEADDIIATLTRRAVAEGYDVRIISGDKDLMQLVSERVELFEPMKNKRYGPDEVLGFDKLLVPPERVRDALALAGDSSDNVPGVRGVGPKKAAKLIADFGELESVLSAAQAGKVKGKLGENLVLDQEAARLSLQLVTLKDDVELPEVPDLDALIYPGPDKAAIRALYQRYEFRRTTPRLGNEEASEPASNAPETPEVPKIQIDRGRYRLVEELKDLEALVEKLRTAERLALAVETSSSRVVDADVLGMAFSWGPGEAVYVPMAGPEPFIASAQVWETLRPVLEDSGVRKVCAETKILSAVLEREAIPFRGSSFDPSLAAYLLDPDAPSNRLETVSQTFLGYKTIDRSELLTEGKKKRQFIEAPRPLAKDYMAERAEVAWQAAPLLLDTLDSHRLRDVLKDVELPLVPVLARMELAGLRVDLSGLRDLKNRFDQELRRLEQLCYEAAGEEFNIGSTKQLQTILFDKLKLKITRNTKTGRSTDHAALEAIADEHPLPQAVLDYRTILKLQNTYVEALPKMVVPSTGRIHTQLNQTVAATGRLSSNEPNLQNIPIRTELGRELRRVFVPSEGCMLISVDYSQVELRVLAHFSEEPVLVGAFEQNADVHSRTAAVLFDVHPEAVTQEQRTQAKAVNFGVLYGMAPPRLARDLKIDLKTASRFIRDYFDRQPNVRRYMDEVLDHAREHEEVRTLLGRRRLISEIHSSNRAARKAAERVVRNTPIQGSAADLIKMAMLRVDALLRDAFPSARLLLQVHDELLVEAPEDEAQAVAESVKDAMERVYPLNVPLVAEAHWGANWDEAH